MSVPCLSVGCPAQRWPEWPRRAMSRPRATSAGGTYAVSQQGNHRGTASSTRPGGPFAFSPLGCTTGDRRGLLDFGRGDT
jgi:hypothetical protein